MHATPVTDDLDARPYLAICGCHCGSHTFACTHTPQQTEPRLPLQGGRPRTDTTFGLLMFLIHLYLGVFTAFDGFGGTVERVGVLAVGFVCVLIGWWCLDAALIWLFGYSRHSIRSVHNATQVFIFLVFAGRLISHSGPVQNLGLVFAMGVLASLLMWLVLGEFFEPFGYR